MEALLSARRRTLPPSDPRIAEALMHRGRVARVTGDLDLAKRCLAGARRILGTRADRVLLAALETFEGNLLRPTDLVGGIRHYRRALELRREAFPSPAYPVVESLTWLAWSLERLGRPEESRRLVAEARAEHDALGLKNTMSTVLDLLVADQLALEGRWQDAEPLYRAVASTLDSARLGRLTGFARGTTPSGGFEALALAALRRGDGEEAWKLLERSRERTHVHFAVLGLWSRRDPRTFAQASALRRDLLGIVRRLDGATRRGRSTWETETWHDQLRALELRAQITSLESRYLREHGTGEPSLDRTRAVLGPRTALVGVLEVHLGGAPTIASQPRHSWGYLYVLRRSGPIRWIPLWDGRVPPQNETSRAEWGNVFARLWRAAEWAERVPADPLMFDQLRAWTHRLFDPVLPYLAGVDKLVIETTRLPVEVFRDAEGRFLLDRFDVSYVPSAALLTLLAERMDRSNARAPRSVLSVSAFSASAGGIEALALDGEPERRVLRGSFRRDETRLGSLPPLEFAGIETATVASRFPEATVLGADGVERELRRMADQGRLRGYDVIHVSTHTLADWTPERFGLALAQREPEAGAEDDGVLDVEEVLLDWQLGAPLVTLSACETAGLYGNTDLGFSPALFAVGARNVLVSLWTVDDRATTILMDRFYQNLTGSYSDRSARRAGEPLEPAAALSEAKIHLRDLVAPTGERPFEHPSYWAGFILIGLPDAG